MRILTTNRFLARVLRTLCCAGILAASSSWATVVNWQLNTAGAASKSGVTSLLSELAHVTMASGVDSAPLVDASHQILFRVAPENGGASEASAGLAGGLNNRPQVSDIGIQQEWHSALSESPARSKQPDESLLVDSSHTSSRPATELDDAITRSTFGEDFVSVPTIQFASTAMMGSPAVSGISAANVGVVPVPEMSALFPIVGLIVAVSCTQILRRRRAAQQSTFRRLV